MKYKNRYLYYSIFYSCLLLVVIGVYVYGYNPPTQNPPFGNLPAPINAGPNPQTKEGDLTVKGNFTTEGILATTGFKMTAGAEANKVLTTDASGVASWQTPAGGGEDTWITTQTCPTDSALQSVGKTTKICINKVDYSDVAYDLSCTDCIGPTEITDSYVLNTSDTMSGTLTVTGALAGATIDTGYGAKEIGDTVGNCAAADVHKGDGACKAESSLSVSYATTAGSAPKGTLACVTTSCTVSQYNNICDTTCSAGYTRTGCSLSSQMYDETYGKELRAAVPITNGCQGQKDRRGILTVYAYCCKIQ